MTAPHDRPTAAELVESVREWLERDVVPLAVGKARFDARVAARVLAMVERELALGADQAAAHAHRLAALGMGDDAELAAAIRTGGLDHRREEVRRALAEAVADKLAVANPTYADRPDPSRADPPERTDRTSGRA